MFKQHAHKHLSLLRMLTLVFIKSPLNKHVNEVFFLILLVLH